MNLRPMDYESHQLTVDDILQRLAAAFMRPSSRLLFVSYCRLWPLFGCKCDASATFSRWVPSSRYYVGLHTKAPLWCEFLRDKKIEKRYAQSFLPPEKKKKLVLCRSRRRNDHRVKKSLRGAKYKWNLVGWVFTRLPAKC